MNAHALCLASILAFAASPARALSPKPPERIDRSVSTVCTFQTQDGPASVQFDVQHGEWVIERGVAFIRVLSRLTVDGRNVPNLEPTCYGHARGGLRCPHGEGETRYEVYPYIDGETDAVEGMRAIVWHGDEIAPAVEGVCGPAK